ncbi:MAG: hypothetical protein GY922_04290, partial [Proteobacteria bacterium]|nr:hypothetical protein [Pseudomonadota bacterium]
MNDFDCSELIAEIAPKIEERPARISVPISGGMDTAERIRGYLAGIMLTPGSRNNTVFSAAGHIKAFVDSDGRGLPEMDLLNLLLEWNAMQSEPITDAEISQTAQSAWRNGTPRELKYPSVEVVDNSDIDLSNIMEPYEIKPSESEVLEFPKLKFRGLVGDITRHIVESALYPQPEFSLFAALSIMSVLTGQKVKDKGGCRTNIMCACVGKSGSGKDWPRVVMQQIFNKIGMDK